MKFFHHWLTFIIAVLLAPISEGLCQTPPSADAMALAKYANIPVSYYTGAAGVNIPLTQLSGKELSVPIGLSYNTSGIKVSTIASTVGLGWNLNAGGQITRVVKGEADDLSGGYCNSSSDQQPDMYFYNFLGQGGKFFLDKNGNAITVPFRNIIIKPGICTSGANGTWEIIDENGVSYKFGTSNFHIETTTVVPNSGSTKSFNSTWLLSEIKSPNSSDKINFSYTLGSYSWKNYSFQKRKDPCSNVVNDLGATITVQARYLISITSSMGNVYFGYSFNRKDLTSYVSLSYVQMFNKSGDLISKHKFDYSHFQSDDCNLPECFRLRLNNIYDLAPDPLYTFSYNTTTNLPSRYSKNFDHWGYYNNNTIDSWFPYIDQEATLFLVNLGPIAPISINGASRVPDLLKMKANILTSISERSGATKTFQYEPHISGKSGSNDVIGGLRIQSISVTNEQGDTYARYFSYTSETNAALSSGIHYKKPKYMVALKTTDYNYAHLIYSHPVNEIYELEGTHIGYSKVIETVSSGGQTVYYFTNFDTNPNTVDQNGRVSDNSWMRGLVTKTLVFSQDGRQLSKQIFDIGVNEPKKRQIDSENNVGWGWQCDCVWFICGQNGSFPASFGWTYVSSPVVQKSQTTEINDPVDQSKKQTTVVENSYDPTTYQLIRSSTYDLSRSNQKYVTSIRYPSHADYDFCTQQYQDCVDTCDPITGQVCMDNCDAQRYNCDTNGAGTGAIAAILKLKKRNQIATPIETTKLYTDGISTKVLSSSVNVFNLEGTGFSQVNLKEVWAMNQVVDESAFTYSKTLGSGAFQFDTRMRKLQANNSYDATTGNLLQQTSLSGIQTNYTWDANNMPISQTVSGGVNSRTTNTNYKLMVGPTTATDANGVVSKKEYDVYNRVSVIKDFQDNILARYRYHYKNEKPNFSIAPQITETLVNTNLSFYVIDIASSIGGTPTFLWDFGDGTTITNGSTSVSHTYTSAGTYTLKLVGMNPEYGATTRTLQIGVFNPLSASVCADGPVYVDICGTNPPSYGSCTSVQDPNGSTQLTATISGGCASSYQYYWQYRNTASTVWTFLGSGQTVSFNAFGGVGTFEISCAITDGCSNQTTATETVTYYKSDPNCASQ